MSEIRAWSRYALAREAFEAETSPRNEGAVVAAYSEWVRGFCPDQAHQLITLLCRNLAELSSAIERTEGKAAHG